MATTLGVDHRLDTVRGLVLGVTMGAALWIAMGGVVWALLSRMF